MDVCQVASIFPTSEGSASPRFRSLGSLVKLQLSTLDLSRWNWVQSSQPTQNFWVYSEFLSFLFYIAEFWLTFWVIWENGSNWSNLRLKMSFFALGRLKNHKVPHLHPNSTTFMPLNRLHLKIYAFSGKFNVCSKRVLLSWIKICRDFTLQTQIFTQKYRSWLRFYSEFLRKKLAAGGSGVHICPMNFMNIQIKIGTKTHQVYLGGFNGSNRRSPSPSAIPPTLLWLREPLQKRSEIFASCM